MVLYESEIFAADTEQVFPFKIIIEKEENDGWERVLVTRINYESAENLIIKNKELLTASGYKKR